MKFSIVVHEAEEGGFWAEVPALGACFGQGETFEATVDDARAAIESHLVALAADGLPIPEDAGLWVETVTIHPPSAA